MNKPNQIDNNNNNVNHKKDRDSKGKNDDHSRITLKVAEENPKDVGRRIARIDPQVCEKLGFSIGDAIELSSSLSRGENRDKAAKAVVLNWPAHEQDYGKGLIRIDGYIRNKLDVGINDNIEIKKVETRDARSITLAPTEPLRILGAEQYVVDILQGQIVTKGDVIPLGIMGRRIDLVVISTNPSKIPVIITGASKVIISEEIADASREKEGRREGLLSVTYEDVGGLRDEVTKVREMIELPLRHPELFKRLGVEAPKGVLLHGPPGTGKTLLVKAIANQSEANFISIKGPELLSKWVGESEKGIREVFRKARQTAPCIIFFDEIDAIAPVRGGDFGDAHVTERVISQLLTELDGLEELREVVVIAASNRPDIVDPALLRPSRFDRILYVPPPGRDSRLQIIKIHTEKAPIAQDDVVFEHLADITEGYTGADIASFVSAAIMLALREHISKYNRDPIQAVKNAKELKVHMRHFEQAMRKIRPLSEQELNWYKRIAQQFDRRPDGTRAIVAEGDRSGIGGGIS